MRQTLYILLWVLCSCVYAQSNNSDFAPVEKSRFGINTSIGASINYTHIFQKLKDDYFCSEMPQDLMGFDVNIMMIYFGLDYWKRNTGYVIFGYKEQVSTRVIRIGPSVWYGKGNSHLVFSPFVEFCSVKVLDTSKNSVGARTYYGEHGKKTGFGMKISYIHQYVEMGLRVSTLSIGVSVGFSIPLKGLFK